MHTRYLFGSLPGVRDFPGVVLALPVGVLQEILLGPSGTLMADFDGVLLFPAFVEQFRIESFLDDVLQLSFSFRCQRICGPFVSGASMILTTVFMSFSKSK